MKKLTITTAHSPPTREDEERLKELLYGISACYMALVLDLEYTPAPNGLVSILTGEKRKQIASEVSECNRMVAFVTFVGLGIQAEIKFSKGKKLVKNIAICFAFKAQRFEVLWGQD